MTFCLISLSDHMQFFKSLFNAINLRNLRRIQHLKNIFYDFLFMTRFFENENLYYRRIAIF